MNALAELRRARGMSMKEVADYLHKPYTTYVNYEKGQREPPIELLHQLADLYQVSMDTLTGRTVTAVPPGFMPLPPTVPVPLLGGTAPEQPLPASAPLGRSADLAMLCPDDSMRDAGLMPGDLVLLRRLSKAPDGCIAAVRLDGALLLRRVYAEGDSLTLVPCSSTSRPLVLRGADAARAVIEGVAVGVTHWLEA